ncbi:riboflavin kinase/FMN adenylyltransferase [Pullulanibacillus pueri]|uniref:FAD synthase n=1 Tax=Pullulanibacillus pueri TaxID=1437324 RepID=A0A8J2ZRV6_9BACL|nr:FAD synthetase family protein [Pullulanibacillus pueri]MBM7679917.1 riboflavin kinase/FMN adenylyltransferase [Pullulanibacillus pueri]GGH73481.1 bifunctional riboflavin kinase/FMN adenylyltransferase [Pullulanibacillus pueri]
MKVIDIAYEPPRSLEPLVLCIGKFDGVHIGHQKLLRRAEQALMEGYQLAVMSFSPHPAWALTGNEKYKRALTPINEKLRLLKKYGVSRFYRVHFTKEYAKTDVDTFVFEHLTRLNLKRIVVGEGFNFGKPYESGTEVLQALCRQINVPVTVVPVLSEEGLKISSTDIRHYVSDGQFEKAKVLLGRDYYISGKVKLKGPNHFELCLPKEHPDGVDGYVLPVEGAYEMMVQGDLDGPILMAKGFRSLHDEDRYHLVLSNEQHSIEALNNRDIRATFVRRIE